ncbi:MAG: hypothetical protein ACOYIF_10440 [Acetivibrionales bacterium]|jgi:hypothetical protein
MYTLIQEWHARSEELDEFFKAEGPVQTIKEEKFGEFLDLCFQRASYFSLMKARWLMAIDNNAEKEFEPFLFKQLRVPKWYCYDLTESPYPSQRVLNINVYYAKHEAKTVFLKYFNNIFLHEQGRNVDDPMQTLEDLCFFSSDSLFVGSVSHEHIFDVYPPDSEFESSLNLFGKWSYSNEDYSFSLEDYIR